MRTFFLAALVGVWVVLGPGSHPPAVRAEGVVITVTSAGNDGLGDGAVCPDATLCTLRAAIETVNADVSDDPFSIEFHSDLFPFDAPVTITVAGSALPAITHANVVVEAISSGVRLDGGGASILTGLTLQGTNSSVLGLAIHGFPGTCIRVEGDDATIGGPRSEGFGNRLGSCGNAIAVSAAGAVIQGNEIGFAAADDTIAAVGDGIVVAAPGGATIGHETVADRGNIIGNATTGIRVGSSGPPVGVTIGQNVIGKSLGGQPASTDVGIFIAPPATSTSVVANTIANAGRGIVVGADVGASSSTGNTFRANVFEGLAGLAIDLNNDGIRNPNDPGDGDTGPNLMRNHPVITRAVQSEITGTAGSSCAGCTVELYVAAHTPGSPDDYGHMPVPGGLAVTNAAGEFSFALPAVDPGDWVIALVTDPQGNTSEFGPSRRVGTGFVQCGAITLEPGWNHAAYFGLDPLPLGSAFPPAAPGSVDAVYEFLDGTPSFARWLRGLGSGQGIASLEPGQEYWFLTNAQVSLAGGLPPLTEPLTVTLQVGWNDFVYIGAGADIRDALASIAGKYTAVYEFANDGGEERWLPYVPGGLPWWAQGLAELEPCGVYQVLMTEPGTLVPLQP